MLTNFKTFLDNLVIESLHPEIRSIVTDNSLSKASKQSRIASKVKELSSKGENTGIEGNMPKGSSRAYLKHSKPEEVSIDGVKTKIQTGTKVVIRADLDKHHDHAKHGGMSLGTLQNHTENGDYHVNNHYRVLSESSTNPGHFKTNEDGIFPPLLAHDHDKHQWSHVGHTEDINAAKFKKLTKNKDYPTGISHTEFHDALVRNYDMANGRYWKGSPMHEARMDKLSEHPLVAKFQSYHDNYGHPPHDYRQKKNLGVWKNPVSGEEHIVARDHGFSNEVSKAYGEARVKKYSKKSNSW